MWTRRDALRLLACGGPALWWGCRSHPDRDALERGAEWLWAQQAENGSIPSHTYGFMSGGQATTPFALLALLAVPQKVLALPTERVSRALGYMVAARDASGALGFAGPAPDYPVYSTGMMLSCLGMVRPEGWEAAAAPSVAWLRTQQLRAEEGWGGHAGEGGFTMGTKFRPVPPNPGHVDLSMTRRALEGLRWAGVPLDDPMMGAARGFVERCQMESGGFIYSPVDPTLNKGETPTSGYGTATTDGVLALLALGADPTDQALSKGLAFLKKIHRPDVNPGIGAGPLAGYARAMRGSYREGAASVFAKLGGPEGWREGIVEAVLADQHPEGFWMNEDPVQKEDDPIIATAFAVRALALARGD